MRLLPLASVIALTLPLGLAVGPTPPPSGATWYSTESNIVVEWLPALVAPDTYTVYGEGPAGLIALATTDGLGASVPGGFSSYYVSATTEGVESERILALRGPCIVTSTSPPFVQVSDGCVGIQGFPPTLP